MPGEALEVNGGKDLTRVAWCLRCGSLLHRGKVVLAPAGEPVSDATSDEGE
jgi:hypothetical protein